VADSGNHAIRRIRDGQVTTIAGMPGDFNAQTGYPEGGYIDGGTNVARFNFPKDIAFTADGSIVVADSMNHAVRTISSGRVRTIVGAGKPGKHYGSAENMALTRPEGVLVDGDTLYISDTYNNRVVAIELSDSVFAGRPSRHEMLEATGLTLDERNHYTGEIRLYVGGENVEIKGVQPWNTHGQIFIPIRPLIEALGGQVENDQNAGVLTITLLSQQTRLSLDTDYFMNRGTAVTTIEELTRLFPYYIEWFPEYSLIIVAEPPGVIWLRQRLALQQFFDGHHLGDFIGE
jgi:hypothetical protein